MGKNKSILFFFFFISGGLSFAQQQTYFVYFKDKASNAFSISSPEQFLSSKALQRRTKCRAVIDEKDLPVSQTYIDQIKATGAQVFYAIKWLNGVVVRSDATVKLQVESLPFVDRADHNIKSRTAQTSATQEVFSLQSVKRCSDYSDRQNDMLGMIKMREDGFNGNGLLIAITDDGFLNADTMKAFESLFVNSKIIDTWDIVDLDKNVYAQGGGHGTHVFSILAGSLAGQLAGPGQGASFVLFRTEDISSESPLEELNWVRAAELADSMGADIIQVSLGYNTFDDPVLDYTQSDLDGKTSYISRGAGIAATRGIVVVVSAGNYGASSWSKILCPADAIGILAVGAVDFNEERASFSSIGYSADGRVKPDVMAMGVSVAYANNSNGQVSFGSGTSFASPLISGLAAGLMQAYPQITHQELIQAVKYSSDRYESPDAYYGYGIPNYERASSYAKLIVDKESELVFPNPFGSHLYVKIKEDGIGNPLQWKLYAITGQLVAQGETIPETSVLDLSAAGELLSTGIYCLTIACNDHFSSFKVIK
jgi:serine protease AprX